MAYSRTDPDEESHVVASTGSSKLFTEAWDLGDIVFSVERRFIYANKNVLSMWSPVMKAMFSDDFVERYATIIELPGKDFDEVLELVRVLHPPNKPVDGKILRVLREISCMVME
jgi:BTB/POZ domain